MTTPGSIGIESIDLADVGCDRVKPGGTCNHLGAHAPLSTIDGVGNAAKEAWIIVGGGTEHVAHLIETYAPRVVVELVQELDF